MIVLKTLARANSAYAKRIGLLDNIALKGRASTNNYNYLTNYRELVNVNQRFFTQQTPKEDNTAKKESYKEDFEKLKKEQDKETKTTGNAEGAQEQAAEKEQGEEVVKTETPEAEKKPKVETAPPKQPNFFSKVVDYVKDTMEETFPSEKYERKKNIKKAQARLQKMAEKIEFTEEELERIQQEIPEWKSKSLINLNMTQEEKVSLAKRLRGQLKAKIDKTSVAQKIYSSEEFKDYDEFRKNMTQFRADLKDHLHQSQNPIVQGSVTLIDKVKSESNTAKAINEMKKIDPTFDIYELERDAAGIFNDIYNAFLEGDLEKIEKQCGDMALGYFKVLLKKREADKVEPKFKELWHVEPADLIGGQVPENKYPVFTFTIRTQEIYCNISKKDQKIVDGAEDRLMYCQYNIVLTPHQNPDLEEIGHGWELVELTQVGNLMALV
eukprot:CAMPEP_0176443002 /NCGR_PEP_ID=MMETSP0127-20121128/22154_1 /TAXON_ID=938130 /ORGANISM="Platyophrya macrostoma, Strain WH" /LENGTH=438 /DNA_ID=CAMNT_0017828129 /DNA_START=53 /DNA_END=1369 /DNA_ORIENTATION=+